MTVSFHSPTTGVFSCPVADGPLNHSLSLPGSKSLTNRELVLACLADSPSTLHAPLHARDTSLMVAALCQLGADISDVAGSAEFGPDCAVTPIPHDAASTDSSEIVVDCGLAGTVMRFIPPVATLQPRPVRFIGDPQAEARPMGPIIDALRQLGHEVDDDGRGTLPFTVRPQHSPSTTRPRVRIDASASSQFVSGLLLAAPRFPAGLTIEHTGKVLPSLPHIDMTIDVLADRGVVVQRPLHHVFDVAPQVVSAKPVVIEPDLSNAAPFMAAAVVAGGSVTVLGWPDETTQVGRLVPELLEHFGATITRTATTVTVTAPGISSAPLPGVTLDLHDAGELAPTFIALSVFSGSPSTFSGISHLRGHETDRIAALVANIRDIGGVAEETPDGIIVTPAPLRGGVWRAWGDHRMATSGALIGLGCEAITVDDIGQTAKTLPEFVSLWQAMLRMPA
jgi:3-phosphoshikimate 1-carboxyvinyltransferase